MADCFSLASLYGGYIRRSISSAGLSSQKIEIDNETTMHFWGPTRNPDSCPNSKSSVILLHGFGPSGIFQWRRQIVYFAPHFNLYVPDFVFFGQSTTKSNERSEMFQAICVGKLMEKIGVKKFSLIGTSYGGFVAYNMALMFPEFVEKVIISSSNLTLTLQDNEEFSKRANVEKTDDVLLPVTANNLRTLLRLSIFRPPPYMPDFFLNDIIRKQYSENKKEKIELLNGLTLGKNNIPVNLTPLQQEVLILWGENDKIFLVDKAFELEKSLGKKVKLEILNKCSHVPQLEQPAQFNKTVMNFLSSS